MNKAKPFIKWAGGKNQLLGQLKNYYPNELKNGTITNYIEPFLDGGSLFFTLSEQFKLEHAYLSDINKDLVLTYQVVKKAPYDLIDSLKTYQKRYDETEQNKRKDLFLSIRKHFNSQRLEINYKNFSDKWIFRASQFIFLNKTCFNGLFRLNLKGEFNVPYGKYKAITLFNESNILAVSSALQNAEIVCADYINCWDRVNENSFVYFAPPYCPISSTANFTTYTGIKFTDKKQSELASFFQKLDCEKKAKLMLSNSDNPKDDFFNKVYHKYNIFKISAKRSINCNGNKREKINELLIINYKHESKRYVMASYF